MSPFNPPAPAVVATGSVTTGPDAGLASVFAVLAIVPSALLAFNLPPSATFLNQAAAVIGWGAWLGFIASAGVVGGARPGRGAVSLVAALALLAAAGLLSWATVLPAPLALSSVALIVAVAGVAVAASTLSPDAADRVFHGLCVALVIAGAISVLIGVLQVLAPGLTAANLIAGTSHEGRAVGNLRQPNHLSSLLLWSAVAAIRLGETGVVRRGVAFALAALFVLGIVLSASRTGLVGVAVLAVWGLADRGLAGRARLALMLLPVVYLLCWLGLSAWSQAGQVAFAGSGRFSADGNISSSRFGIWRDTLSLIAAHPWLGVGFGEFNFAWSLTPFPQRPVAFFDHTHNLPLQFLVELGLPIGALVLALLAHALWRAFVGAREAQGADAGVRRAALVMLLLMVIHSQLEYPLWYAYFALPTACFFGLCLRGFATAATARPAVRIAMQAGAVAMLAGGVASVVDYHRVATIFESDDSTPLVQRIADGQRSWLFAHHAHYAAATIAEHPSQAMSSFQVATHYLLDTRLMIAWANALNEAGDVERARHLAQRLREFRNADSKPYFAPCDDPADAVTPLPYQCTPPTRRFDYRDFR
jgi:O-antigen ligase